ncbi:MAG: AMP-binding protein [Bacteroidota bacterium]
MTQPTTVVRLFFESADRFPDHTAFIERQREITYKELAREVLQTATYFMREGIRKHDRVLIFVPIGIDLFRIILALMYLGAIPVLLDEWVNKTRLDMCCRIANCQAWVGTKKARFFGWMFSSELRKIPIKLGLKFPAIPAFPPITDSEPEETALISFTTGSSGIPIAANRTHAFLMEQFKALKLETQPLPEDISMSTLPIALLINLAVGASSIIPDFNAQKPESMKARRLYEQLKTHKATRLTASPFIIQRIAEFMIYYNLHLPDLVQITTGGAPVFPEEALVYHTAFGSASINIIYGSEEAEPISSVSGEELASKTDQKLDEGLCVGKPFRGAEVRVIHIHNAPISIQSKEELAHISSPNGQIGEIIVSGPHVLTRYINHPEALRRNKIFLDDQVWHRTGDAGYLDDSGKLYLTGRCHALIRHKKRYYAPFLYENFFKQMEGVGSGTILEAGQGILAVVELQEQSQRERIRSRIDFEGLPYDRLVFLHKIPRDPNHHSRIDYQALRELLG